MSIFETIGEWIMESFFHGLLFDGVSGIYNRLTGKKRVIHAYRTEQKKFIKFSVANKFLLTKEKDLNHLKEKLTDGLDALNEKLVANNFQFIAVGDETIVQPPASISFYSFHFLVQWLTEYKIKTLGVVETARTVYTTYNDPNSENLIDKRTRERSSSFH
jgi:hypothetical protein